MTLSWQWLWWRGPTQTTAMSVNQYPMFVVAALHTSTVHWTIAWRVVAFTAMLTAWEAIPIYSLWRVNNLSTQLRQWREQFLPILATRACLGYGMANLLLSTLLMFRLTNWTNLTCPWHGIFRTVHICCSRDTVIWYHQKYKPTLVSWTTEQSSSISGMIC